MNNNFINGKKSKIWINTQIFPLPIHKINHNVHIMEHLTVTCVKPNRGFLDIYGHKKPELLDQLNAEISAYKPFIKKIAAPNEVYPNPEFDTIYLALAAQTERYHRCTVREKRPNNKAIIDLIDYGNDYEVDTTCVSTTTL